MVSQRVSAFVGSGLLVVGAILLGDALHVTLVRGEAPLTDPDVLFRATIGVAAVIVGYRLDVHPREYLSLPSDRERGDTAGGEGERERGEARFDEALSPLDGEAFDAIEAREDGEDPDRGRDR